MSASGQYMTVTMYADDVYYRSSDYGQTFTSVSLTGSFFRAALSASGQYQVLAANSGYSYRSSDYGVTFTATSVTGSQYQNVAVSASGQYQTFANGSSGGGGGLLRRSGDYGATFTSVGSSTIWASIGISASGQYQVAIDTAGYINISIDYGLTWTVTPGLASTASWSDIFISASGQYITAIVSDGNVWTCSNPLFGINFSGRVGINCNAPAYTLDVGGLAHQSNDSASWYVVSDRRIKTDIVNANLGICMSSLRALPLRYYQYNSNMFPDRGDKHVIGCVAQEVQQLFPKAVSITSNYGISDLMGVDYDQIFKANLGATQYLGEIVESQSTQIATLLAQVSTMNDTISYIPQLVSTLSGLGH